MELSPENVDEVFKTETDWLSHIKEEDRAYYLKIFTIIE